jgi:hypothetical protein
MRKTMTRRVFTTNSFVELLFMRRQFRKVGVETRILAKATKGRVYYYLAS